MKFKKIIETIAAFTIAFSTFSGFTYNAYAYEKGDVNHDGAVDSSDATQILIYYANSLLGNSIDIDRTVSDVNSDGIVDSSDATVILICYAHNLLGENYTVDDVVAIANIDYYDVYYPVLRKYPHSSTATAGENDDALYGYTLYDLDHDGVKELIVCCGGGATATINFRIYTIKNGQATMCLYSDGEYKLYMLDATAASNANDFYFVGQHTGGFYYSKVNLNGTTVVTSKLKTIDEMTDENINLSFEDMVSKYLHCSVDNIDDWSYELDSSKLK